MGRGSQFGNSSQDLTLKIEGSLRSPCEAVPEFAFSSRGGGFYPPLVLIGLIEYKLGLNLDQLITVKLKVLLSVLTRDWSIIHFLKNLLLGYMS